MTRGVREHFLCSVEKCNKKHFGKGFCEQHYRDWRKENLLDECSIIDCKLKVKNKGYCSKHYTRLYRYGDPNYFPPKKISKAKCRSKHNFFSDLRATQEDSSAEFDKILKDRYWELLA